MLRWYQTKLAARPLLTPSITTAALFGAGDVLAQQLVDRKGFDKHDYARTGRMVMYGGAIFGPAATTWYGILQRNIVLKSTAATIVARVAADQALFTPTHLFCFLSSMSILEGNDPIEKLQKSFWPTYRANLTLWPAVQLANFSIVPLEHRVLVVNLVSLGWNCFLSLVNSK
ncbi:hypothetical protein VTN96DRAFT_9245 [Rasamsonia emersonii]|uniref:Integral membrane protein, Mpv17/PMP22 family n=1 Tax=Rasamsonia emersonii (strain ATCC 16479 / CBS 393.64 / IMI 116815) TaxID=1408163 RepID=A0A0F4YYW5_RASE3|nr:Integral membrane protein, Mpv17/PMP22 family [Rasamsonia emersonii CBS 393.64]KKA23487.1 Integral membrane protein, Mpv17/PMP22 family [Rasamsonia emersonii CBS 393.64]